MCIRDSPSFVANNGRLGFDAEDYHVYAPECASPIRVMWLAVHKDNAHFACLSTMDYDSLLRDELGADTVARLSLIHIYVEPIGAWPGSAHTNPLSTTSTG